MKRTVKLVVVATLLAAGLYFYDRFHRPPGPEELAALKREHEALREHLRRRLAVEAEPEGAAPASVTVGIPVPFAQRFAQEASARLLQDMTLTLRGLKVEKTGELQAGVLGQLGRFTLWLQLDDVRATLRAEKPLLSAAAPRLAVTLPLRIVKGTGKGRLRLRWDGAGVAGGVCGDFEIAGPVAGDVVPALYRLRARLTLETDGPTLAARPELEDVAFPLNVEPTAETWKLVDDAIQARPALCRTALAAADVPEKIRALVARGFPVKLPRHLLPRIEFPVEMERAIDVDGAPLRLHVKAAGIEVARARVWYRADVRVLETEEAAPGDDEAAAPTADATAEPTASPGPLEGEADAEAEPLVVVPAVEEQLQVRPQPQAE